MKLEYANNGEFALVVENENPWNNDPDNRIYDGKEFQGYPYPIYHNRYTKPEIYNKFKGLRGRVVLDLGCGYNPFPWANILVNKNLDEPFRPRYLKEDSRAEGNGTTYMTKDGRILWVVNVLKRRLPFGDKEIDFVYASHVYEHLNKPEPAFQETIRCGKEGIIIGPDREWELLYTQFPFDDKRVTDDHQWYIEMEGEDLNPRAKLFVFNPSDGCHLCRYMVDVQEASVLRQSDRLVFRLRTDEEREFTEKRMDRESVAYAVKRFQELRGLREETPHRGDLRVVEGLLPVTPEELVAREHELLREYNEKLLPMYKNPSPTELHWHGTIIYDVRDR